MPARAHQVLTALWGRRFRPVSPEAKLVHLYCLTCPHRRSEGLYELAPAHVAVDVGLTVDRVEEALQELHDAGLLLVDPDNDLVLDPDALRVNPLRNGVNTKGPVEDKRIKPAVAHFELLPASPLRARFVEIAEEWSPDLAAAIRRRLGDSFLPDPWEAPSDAPSPGPSDAPSHGALQAPSSEGAFEGASQHPEAPIRCDASTSGRDGPPPCAWCGESALVREGVVQVGPGDLPYCTYCDCDVEVSGSPARAEPDADRPPDPARLARAVQGRAPDPQEVTA